MTQLKRSLVDVSRLSDVSDLKLRQAGNILESIRVMLDVESQLVNLCPQSIESLLEVLDKRFLGIGLDVSWGSTKRQRMIIETSRMAYRNPPIQDVLRFGVAGEFIPQLSRVTDEELEVYWRALEKVFREAEMLTQQSGLDVTRVHPPLAALRRFYSLGLERVSSELRREMIGNLERFSYDSEYLKQAARNPDGELLNSLIPDLGIVGIGLGAGSSELVEQVMDWIAQGHRCYGPLVLVASRLREARENLTPISDWNSAESMPCSYAEGLLDPITVSGTVSASRIRFRRTVKEQWIVGAIDSLSDHQLELLVNEFGNMETGFKRNFLMAFRLAQFGAGISTSGLSGPVIDVINSLVTVDLHIADVRHVMEFIARGGNARELATGLRFLVASRREHERNPLLVSGFIPKHLFTNRVDVGRLTAWLNRDGSEMLRGFSTESEVPIIPEVEKQILEYSERGSDFELRLANEARALDTVYRGEGFRRLMNKIREERKFISEMGRIMHSITGFVYAGIVGSGLDQDVRYSDLRSSVISIVSDYRAVIGALITNVDELNAKHVEQLSSYFRWMFEPLMAQLVQSSESPLTATRKAHFETIIGRQKELLGNLRGFITRRAPLEFCSYPSIPSLPL